jgi:hypothetical protein
MCRPVTVTGGSGAIGCCSCAIPRSAQKRFFRARTDVVLPIVQTGHAIALVGGTIPQLGVLITRLRDLDPLRRRPVTQLGPGFSVATRARAHEFCAPMSARVAARCELLVRGLLIFVGAALIAIAHGLIVIRQRLISIARGLVATLEGLPVRLPCDGI